jgi:hypothetical protein
LVRNGVPAVSTRVRRPGATADIREARFGLISCRFDPS